MRKYLSLILLPVVLALAGCREGVDYEYAVNNDWVQLGCAGHVTDEPPSQTPPARGSCFRLGLPWWIGDNRDRPAYGLALSLLADSDIFGRGVAISPLLVREHMAGVGCGYFLAATELRGVSVALLNFISGRGDLQLGVLNVAEFLYAIGYVDVQLGAFMNSGGGAGVQIAPFNRSNGNNRFQFGLVNCVDDEREPPRSRFQFGLVNIATSGFQLGLVNVNGNAAWLKVLPLVNF